MVLIDTLTAINEYSASATASVNAIVLGSEDEVTRLVTNLDTWNDVRISFKAAISASSGDLTATSFFIGLCSETRSYGNFDDQHCWGFLVGGFGQPSPGGIFNGTTFTSNTSPDTVPPNDTWYYSSVLYTSAVVVTGSLIVGGGATGVFNRHNTQWPAGFSGSKAGHAWAPFVISMGKSSSFWGAGKLQLGYSTYGQTGASGNPQCLIYNIPQSVFRMSAQYSLDEDTTNTTNGWRDWYDEIGSGSVESINWGRTGFQNTNTLQEGLYGPLKYLNIFFKSTKAGAKLLIRDIIITKLD